MAYNDYKVVTPVGTVNPKREGWYEKNGSVYSKTNDTTAQVGKTYYTKGYLVKVGDYTIPFRYIKADTYSCVWSATDFDSYRDANGTLHRDSVAPNRVMKVEWETPDMSDSEFETLMANIRAQYLTSDAVDGEDLFKGKKAKSCYVTAWMPEEHTFKTDTCYLTSDVNFSIRYADENGIRYNPVRFAFIGYSKPTAT